MPMQRRTKVILAATLTAAAVGAGVIYTRRQKLPQLPSGGTGGNGGSLPSGKHLGTGWDGWASKDVLGSEAEIAAVLEVLGYDCGPCIGDGGKWVQNDRCAACVRNFQSDTNTIREWLSAIERGEDRLPPNVNDLSMIPPVLAGMAGGPNLGVDSLAGRNTIAALVQSVEAVEWATGTTCRGPADPSTCRDAWQNAVRFAHAANLNAGSGAQS